MNYLAHIFLSGNDRCIQIGNFIGDGVKGDGYKQYPRKFQQGILLHREIDAFSDRHPLVREAVGIGRETFGRYSAVVNDILFDYFLASRFQDYAGLPLFMQEHGERLQKIFREFFPELHERCKQSIYLKS